MVYIILGQGFEEIEALSPCDILRRGGVPVRFAAVGESKTVAGAHGILITADVFIRDISPSADDTIVIPGGMGGVNSIKGDEDAMELIKNFAKAGAKLAAICAGPSVLSDLGLIDGKTITCYPGSEKLMGNAVCKLEKPIVADVNLITGRAPGSAIEFGLELLSHIKDRKIAEKIRTELVY